MHLSIRPIRLAVLSAGFTGLVSSSALAVPEYRFSDLGLPADQSGRVYSINELGQVVGGVGTATARRAFVYSASGGIQMLDTPDGSNSAATTINELGQVAGYSWSPQQPLRPAMWAPGQSMRDLGAPNLQCGATPTSLNDRGQVVWYTFGTEEIRAYLSDGSGPPLRYETLGGDKSNAFDINNKGQIVGGCTVSTAFYSPWHAYRREPDGTMRDLGTVPGATSSMAYDINEQSQVVGESGNHAVLWEEGGAMRDLGTLDNQSTRALAINESGLVVGRSTVGSVDHAFLYDGSTMLDLNSLVTLPAGWTLTEAWDINNAGQIVGYASFNGLNRAFLLTPVPEPTTVASLCVLGMMFLRRSKR